MSGWLRDRHSVQRNLCIRDRVVFVAVLTLVVSLLAPLRAQTEQSFDAGCRTRSAEACPANPIPNALLALAEECAMDLKRNPNCCAHSKTAARDYAITKDCAAEKPEGYLLIPLERVGGVEDQRIFNPPFVDLWAEAWRWSRELPGQPPSRTALAINSAHRRSQPQLHIHISCVDRAVSAALEYADIPWFPAKPRELPKFGPRQHTYRAVKVSTLTGESSPFLVVMRQVGKSAMQHHGIAVIGASKGGEFYVLETSEEDGGGHAEDLLDQRCDN